MNEKNTLVACVVSLALIVAGVTIIHGVGFGLICAGTAVAGVTLIVSIQRGRTP